MFPKGLPRGEVQLPQRIPAATCAHLPPHTRSFTRAFHQGLKSPNLVKPLGLCEGSHRQASLPVITSTPDAHLVLPYLAVLQQNYNPVFSRQFLLCCWWQVCCGILCVSKHLKGFLLQRSSESLRRMPKGGRREEPPSGFQTVFRGAQGFPGGTARSSTGGPRERPCKDNAKRGPSPHLLSLIFIPLK